MAELRAMNLANFELSQLQRDGGVYSLADGLVPEIARVFDVDLGNEPNAEALGELVGALGKNKVLQENLPQVHAKLGTGRDGLNVAADWVERSGLLVGVDRSLWTPEVPTPEDIEGIVLTGGVANWQDRAVAHLRQRVTNGAEPAKVYYPVGNELMNSKTEVTNPNVQAYYEAYGEYPTQAQYAKEVLDPQLGQSGYEVKVMPYDTKSGDEIAARFVAEAQEVLGGKLAVARVANAAIQLATQVRSAARELDPKFDTNPANPQMYLLADNGLPLSRTEAQAKDPANFQNSYTGVRQVVLAAKLLHLAQG